MLNTASPLWDSPSFPPSPPTPYFFLTCKEIRTISKDDRFQKLCTKPQFPSHTLCRFHGITAHVFAAHHDGLAGNKCPAKRTVDTEWGQGPLLPQDTCLQTSHCSQMLGEIKQKLWGLQQMYVSTAVDNLHCMQNITTRLMITVDPIVRHTDHRNCTQSVKRRRKSDG